jgi:hypothetical protein
MMMDWLLLVNANSRDLWIWHQGVMNFCGRLILAVFYFFGSPTMVIINRFHLYSLKCL